MHVRSSLDSILVAVARLEMALVTADEGVKLITTFTVPVCWLEVNGSYQTLYWL